MRMTVPRLVLLTAWILPAQQSLLGANDLVVVVANNSAVVAIAPDDLREIFLGTQHSLPNGSRVIPVLLKSGPVHELFLKAYLGKSVEGFRTWWLQIVFTGQGLLPKSFASEADLVDYVGRTPGAIGYAMRASVKMNVKCLPVTPARKAAPGGT